MFLQVRLPTSIGCVCLTDDILLAVNVYFCYDVYLSSIFFLSSVKSCFLVFMNHLIVVLQKMIIIYSTSSFIFLNPEKKVKFRKPMIDSCNRSSVCFVCFDFN